MRIPRQYFDGVAQQVFYVNRQPYNESCIISHHLLLNHSEYQALEKLVKLFQADKLAYPFQAQQ